MRESLNKSEAKVAQQKSIISYQREEIDEYEKKIKNQDEQLKKMEELVAKAKNDFNRIDKENAELKNKVNEPRPHQRTNTSSKARVLYNYQAGDNSEITLAEGQEVEVSFVTMNE